MKKGGTVAAWVSSSSPFGVRQPLTRLRIAPWRKDSKSSSSSSSSSSVQDAQVIAQTSSDDATSSSPPPLRKTIWQTLDDAGSQLKPWAFQARQRSQEASRTTSRVGFTVLSCVYFVAFMLYRAYRGFFVLIPAVFSEVYVKMETAMQNGPFEYDPEAMVKDDDDDKPWWSMIRQIRQSAVVSCLAALVTLTYVVSGAFRVLGKFLQTVTQTSNVSNSLEAAADQVLQNEDKIRKFAKKEET